MCCKSLPVFKVVLVSKNENIIDIQTNGEADSFLTCEPHSLYMLLTFLN